MKTLLIIYPHWPPSNLAGVHRPRLIANNLTQHGWHPVVLTVSHKYYEEDPDWDLVKTVNRDVEVHYVKAFRITRPRVIGDIGLRGMYFLYRRAKQLIANRKIDFIWIPIPSFYTALLGRWLYEKFRIPYGIDYIDPWVRDISGRKNFRSVSSLWLAKFLEPIAVKKASLITGVAFDYYRPVLERNFPFLLRKPSTNPQINKSTGHPIGHLSFPYGFDRNDYSVSPTDSTLPWGSDIKFPFVYAGAFLPNARAVMKLLFQALKELKEINELPEGLKLYFIGTGYYSGVTIKDLSFQYGIEDYIVENRDRLPYLTILNILKNAFGVMVIGSTEPHYTASKTYQALLSTKPVLALLHQKSQAHKVFVESGADKFTNSFENLSDMQIGEIQEKLRKLLSNNDWNPDLKKLEKFAALHAAKMLVCNIEDMIR